MVPEKTADSAEITPAWASMANTCLNDASPPIAGVEDREQDAGDDDARRSAR